MRVVSYGIQRKRSNGHLKSAIAEGAFPVEAYSPAVFVFSLPSLRLPPVLFLSTSLPDQRKIYSGPKLSI